MPVEMVALHVAIAKPLGADPGTSFSSLMEFRVLRKLMRSKLTGEKLR